MMAPISVGAAPAAVASSAPPAATTSTPAAPVSEDGPHMVFIKSPMVGTFYTRPKPDAPSYVKMGDRVGPETTVCIIEAMKTFNEIPAGVSGVIVAVLAKNEEPVDYDRPLFKVDTSR
jgi:acetyl-CoA carboxylase biotin carboxyl carrier protein